MKEKLERKYIRKIYLIPSLLVIVVFVIGSFLYSNILRNALLANLKINSTEIAEGFIKEIEYGMAAKKTIESLLEDKIRSTARILFRNSENLSNQLLYDLSEDLEVDEIHWFNRDGKLIYSTVEGYLGWQTHPKHPLYVILQGQKELMEDIRPDEKYGRLLKHGAVREEDGTFVQVAISAETVQELTEKFSFENLISEIGEKENILYVGLLT